MPEIVKFPVETLADIPARLRDLADRIEAGKKGDVDAVVVILGIGAVVDLYGYGTADPRGTMGLLGLAARKVETDV